jgi:hypothetical protein
MQMPLEQLQQCRLPFQFSTDLQVHLAFPNQHRSISVTG